MLYVLYKKWGWLLNRKGARLLEVDVKNGLLLVALNEIKLFYPWSCFSNFASSQEHFNLKGKLHTPAQISLSCLNESLRREVVLKVKVETGCSTEWCVSGALGRTGIPQNRGQALSEDYSHNGFQHFWLVLWEKVFPQTRVRRRF